METPGPLLRPLPYHSELRDYLKQHERELWHWFASAKAKADYTENLRLELLKTTYRLDTTSHPDLFRAVVIMSAGGGQNLEASYPGFFANSAAAAKQMRLMWLGVGDGDFALNGMKALDDVLTKHGVKHTFVVRPGYRHEWRLWRLDLSEFAPLLFQNR